ncbi:MAG: hypothetical protein MK202_03095 [Tenacibaculum sp.]|nr:hypothetical protein [Tenacibaculum sp.]MCH2032483.1 hypothetical protein [Tenacibaculum sp.]
MKNTLLCFLATFTLCFTSILTAQKGKNLSPIELSITSYSYKYGSLDLDLQLKNNSDTSIFIIIPNDGTHGTPEFFSTQSFPNIELCEISETEVKPLTHIIEIKGNSKKSFTYKEAFAGACEDINGKSIDFQVSYEFDSSNEEYINYLERVYDNDKTSIQQFKKLFNLKLNSNRITIKIPR